jgi:hypothetical protein
MHSVDSEDIDREQSGERRINVGKNPRSGISKEGLLIVIASCFLQIGCRAVQTIWSAEAPSPDGYWLATAKTEQHAGYGTAGIVTKIYLKRTNGSYPPIEILEFFHDPRDSSTTINLSMNWTGPSHLNVKYNGRASIDLQTVKFAGVDISVQDLSNAKANTSH